MGAKAMLRRNNPRIIRGLVSVLLAHSGGPLTACKSCMVNLKA